MTLFIFFLVCGRSYTNPCTFFSFDTVAIHLNVDRQNFMERKEVLNVCNDMELKLTPHTTTCQTIPNFHKPAEKKSMVKYHTGILRDAKLLNHSCVCSSIFDEGC